MIEAEDLTGGSFDGVFTTILWSIGLAKLHSEMTSLGKHAPFIARAERSPLKEEKP
jgi:hypothetical protein